MKRTGIILLLFSFYCSFLKAGYDGNELKELREKNLISQDEYEILLNDLNKTGRSENIYLLYINGRKLTNLYKIIKNDNAYYLSLFEFLNSIEFKNYNWKNDKLELLLGDSLKKIEFDFNKNILKIQGEKEEISIENGYIKEKNLLYIRKDFFEKIFTNYINIDENEAVVKMLLKFTTPSEITKALERKQENLLTESERKEFLYTNPKKLFDLGYLRVNLTQDFNKLAGEKIKKDWSGFLEYQGPTLFGELTTSYDLRDEKLLDIKLEYPDIWKGHTFEINNRLAGKESREWDITFSKRRDYYQIGKNFIITESVPIGSRAELLYMGVPIQIEDAENGQVTFRSAEIIADRTYQLKVYTPDGKILVKNITTTENYNQQNKGEVEYDINIRENHDKERYTSNINMFYGVTDHLTLGAGYSRELDVINNKVKYLDLGRAELVYGNTINSYAYTLKLGGDKAFNSYKTETKDYSERYGYDVLGQINIGKFKYIAEHNRYGSYYDEKNKTRGSITYTLNEYLELDYEHKREYFYNGKHESNSTYGLTASYNYKKLLMTLDIDKSKDDPMSDEYSMRFYYSGFDNYTTKLENKWTNSGKNYEVNASLFNNNFQGLLDYTLEAGYSDKDKERLTFKVSIKYDNWFTFDADADKKGNQSYRVGVDKIVDLKNPTYKLDSMDSTRVRTITFIDENNNNKFDKGEKRVDGVEVKIGNRTQVTDKNGETVFLGISNGIIHQLDFEIKKPSYSLDGNIIKVRGETNATIDAYIPIKPMVNLNGFVYFDEKLNLTEEEKMEVYDEILINIKDFSGNTIELTIPDNTGIFDVSGLFPEKYIVEVNYIGTKYDLPPFTEVIKLAYYEDDSEGNKWVFKMGEKSFSIKKVDNDELVSKVTSNNDKI